MFIFKILVIINFILLLNLNYRISEKDKFELNLNKMLKGKKINDYKIKENGLQKKINLKETNTDFFKDFKNPILKKSFQVGKDIILFIIQEKSNNNFYILKKNFFDINFNKTQIEDFEKIFLLNKKIYLIKKNKDIVIYNIFEMKKETKDDFDLKTKLKDIEFNEIGYYNNLLYIKNKEKYIIYFNNKKYEEFIITDNGKIFNINSNKIKRIIFTNFFIIFFGTNFYYCEEFYENKFFGCKNYIGNKIYNTKNFMDYLFYEKNNKLLIIDENSNNVEEFKLNFNFKDFNLKLQNGIIYGNEKNNLRFFIYYIENKMLYIEESSLKNKKCLEMIEYYLCINDLNNNIEKYYKNIKYKINNYEKINEINLRNRNKDFYTFQIILEKDYYKIYQKKDLIENKIKYNFIDSYFLHKLFLKGNDLNLYSVNNNKFEKILYYNEFENNINRFCDHHNNSFIKLTTSKIIIVCQKGENYYFYKTKYYINIIDKNINIKNYKKVIKIDIKDYYKIKGIDLSDYKLHLKKNNNEQNIFLINKNKIIVLNNEKEKMKLFNENKKYINCIYNSKNYFCFNENEIDINNVEYEVEIILKKISKIVSLNKLKIKEIKFFNYSINFIVANLYNSKYNYIFKFYKNKIYKMEKKLVLKTFNKINHFCYFSLDYYYYAGVDANNNFFIKSLYNNLLLDYNIFFEKGSKILELICKYELEIIIVKYEINGDYYFNFLRVNSQINERLIKKLKVQNKDDKILTIEKNSSYITFIFIKIGYLIKTFVYFKEGPFIILSQNNILSKKLYLKKNENYFRLNNYNINLELFKKFSKNEEEHKVFYLEINELNGQYLIPNNFNHNILNYEYENKNKNKIEIFKNKESIISKFQIKKDFKFYYFNLVNKEFFIDINNKKNLDDKILNKMLHYDNDYCKKKHFQHFLYCQKNHIIKIDNEIYKFFELNHTLKSVNIITLNNFKLLFAINGKNNKEILIFFSRNKTFYLKFIFNSLYFFNDNKTFFNLYVFYNPLMKYIHFISYEKYSSNIYFFTLKDLISFNFIKKDFLIYKIGNNIINKINCFKKKIDNDEIKFECAALLENNFKLFDFNYNKFDQTEFMVHTINYELFDFTDFITTLKSKKFYKTDNYIIVKSKNRYSYFDFLVYKKNSKYIQFAGTLEKNDLPLDYLFYEEKIILTIYILIKNGNFILIKKFKYYDDIIIDINKLILKSKTNKLAQYIYLKEKFNTYSLTNNYEYNIKIFICTQNCIKILKISYIILFSIIFISNAIFIMYSFKKKNNYSIKV